MHLVLQAILEGLEAKGHALKAKTPIGAVVQGVYHSCVQDPDRCLEAVSDSRKLGYPDGF